MDPVSIAILFSGNGTNMQSIIHHVQRGHINARIACALSNQTGAYGLTRAQKAGIPTHIVRHDRYQTRKAFEEELIRVLERYQVKVIVLAGFMRILSEVFVDHFRHRILNIHPSLLPKYPGLHTHRRVLDAKESKHGCSVHFVTEGLDEGPVVIQAEVPVLVADEIESLTRRVLEKEHLVLPLAMKWLCQGKLYCNDGTVYFDGAALKTPIQLSESHCRELE